MALFYFTNLGKLWRVGKLRKVCRSGRLECEVCFDGANVLSKVTPEPCKTIQSRKHTNNEKQPNLASVPTLGNKLCTRIKPVLNNQHRISITEETVFVFDGFFVGLHGEVVAGECAGQNQ